MSKEKNLVKNIFKPFFILSLAFFLTPFFVLANEENIVIQSSNNSYYINLDKNTIDKGFTVATPDNNLKLSLIPGILSDSTGVETVKINEEMNVPWQIEKISAVYQFEFKNKAAYDNKKPFYIQLSYEKATNNYKQVFFYDKNFNSWRPLPTKDFPAEKFVRSLIYLPYARIAVFEYPAVLSIGKASWYKYKNGNFAASPDFPKGSKIRVYNLANNKFVDVEINDYGPERNLHPDRVIDLDKVAFKKISALSEGVINIKIEPLLIKPANGRVLGIGNKGAFSNLVISSKSAVLTDEKSGKIIFEKNSTSTLPLASLTKIIAVKVFLDSKPTLSDVVSYSLKDEEYNYQYVNKWESGRLRAGDGEKMTIEDLIYSSLVGSANNTVESLARLSGEPRGNFINKMNQTVKNWGASSTFFVEPSGLSPENVSSALDYAIITKEALKNPIIEKASKMEKYKFFSTRIDGKKILHNIINTNKLVGANSFHISGSKTGYLEEAGYCLMTRVKISEGKELIGVIMGSSSREESFREMEDLVRYGIKNEKI